MGLDEIIGKIETDAEGRAHKAIEDAKAEADRITNGAKAKAQEKLSQMSLKATNESKVIMTRESSRAATEASQMYQERLNEEVAKSMDSIKAAFPSYTKSEEYTKLLNKLAAKAAGELGEACTLYVRGEDVGKIKPGRFTVLESQDNIPGGLNAVSKDGFRYVDYTLDTLLANISDGIAVEILKLIK